MVLYLQHQKARDKHYQPINFTIMATTTDIQKMKSDLINKINEINNGIERKLSVMCIERCNHVVVSKDFFYYVTCDNNGHAGVGFTQDDNAVRLTKKEAERISKVFHAENGYGKIEWVVMPTNQYLTKLLQKNNDLLAFINR